MEKEKIIKDEENIDTSLVLENYNKDDVKLLRWGIENNKNILIQGHTGLGKTHLISLLAKEINTILHRISLSGGITEREILGKYIAKEGTTIWEDGLLIKAMKEGQWIVFDEINACEPGVLFILQALTDDDRRITLIEKNGEVIIPHPNFRLFATRNPNHPAYSGVRDLNVAFLSRFQIVMEIKIPDVIQEIKIVESKGITLKEDQWKEVFGFVSLLRKQFLEETILYFPGTRDVISACEIYAAGFDINSVYKIFFAKMTEDDVLELKNKGLLNKDTLNSFIKDFETNPEKKIEELKTELQKQKAMTDVALQERQKSSEILESKQKEWMERINALEKEKESAVKMETGDIEIFEKYKLLTEPQRNLLQALVK